MNEFEFEQFLAFGREQRGVEFKGPGSSTDKRFRATVARAMLALANIRDGGIVIIGVTDSLEPLGLDSEKLDSWKDYDTIADRINRYAEPPIAFTLEILSYQEKNFVAIKVDEFVDVPHLCRVDDSEILVEGALYIRPRAKPESSQIKTHTDMRDLLDLMQEKSLRKILRTVSRAGAEISNSAYSSDKDKFDQQLGDIDV